MLRGFSVSRTAPCRDKPACPRQAPMRLGTSWQRPCLAAGVDSGSLFRRQLILMHLRHVARHDAKFHAQLPQQSQRRGDAEARMIGGRVVTATLYAPLLPACKTQEPPVCSRPANHEQLRLHPSGLSSVKTRKAVITAAGRTQRNLPLQTLVDRDASPNRPRDPAPGRVAGGHRGNRPW